MSELFTDSATSSNTLGGNIEVTIADYAPEDLIPLLNTPDVITEEPVPVSPVSTIAGFAFGLSLGTAAILHVNASYDSGINKFTRTIAHEQIGALKSDINSQNQAVTDARGTTSGSNFMVIYNAAKKQIAYDEHALPLQYAELKEASPQHLSTPAVIGIEIAAPVLGVWAAIAIKNRILGRRHSGNA